jgi:hypothetical protein
MGRGPKNLEISFTGKNLTHFGGVYLISLFLRCLQLKSILSQSLRLFQRNNHYSITESILALMYPSMLGIGRIETTHLLKRNGVFHYLVGIPAYPNPTTLRRFLQRISPDGLAKLRSVQSQLLKRMLKKPRPAKKIILDMDSTVLVLYGKQELATIGYNPTKRGRPSYHPLLCFDGITKDCIHAELRSGNTYTSSGTTSLLETSFAKIPQNVKRVYIRADKGFYDHDIIEKIEEHSAVLFTIAAKLTSPIKRRLSSLRYHTPTHGIEAAEFLYQPIGWKKRYRFIVIRRPIPEDPTEQLTLFSVGKFSYQVMVTNMELKPINIWRFYNGRAGVELIIKELKNDYPVAKIPTKHFASNESYFHILLFSYNVVNWFKRLCLPQEFQTMTLGSLRARLLLIPGELVHSGNRPVLKLPSHFRDKDAVMYALKKISKLVF